MKLCRANIAKDIANQELKVAVSSVTGAADLPAYATQGALAGIDFLMKKFFIKKQMNNSETFKALSKMVKAVIASCW